MTGKIRSLGATLALAGVMLLGACDAGGGGGNSGTSMSNADLLKAAAKNMRELTSYSIDLDADQAGQAVKMQGDIDKTNNNLDLSIDSAGTVAKVRGVGEDYFMSADNGTTYTPLPAGSAASITGGLDSFASVWTEMDDASIDKVKDNLKDGGSSAEVPGTKHITANAADLAAFGGSGATAEGTMDIWVTTASPYYVRQMKIDAKSGGQDVKATIKWDNFNKTFDIKAP